MELDDEHLARLTSKAARLGISFKRLVLQRLSCEAQQPRQSHGELDALAGSCSTEEAEVLSALISPLEQVEPDVWG